MDKTEWRQVKAIFEQAFALPAEDRHAFIETACVGKPSLKNEVHELLRFSDDSPFILDKPVDIPASLLLNQDNNPPILGAAIWRLCTG